MSFPPEAKRCVHCGGRLGAVPLGVAPGGTVEPLPIDPDEEMPQRSFLRTGLGSIWILLALVATCYRVCTG